MRYINSHSVISAEEVQDRRSQNVRSGVNSARFLLVRFVYGLYGWFICALCTCPCKLLTDRQSCFRSATVLQLKLTFNWAAFQCAIENGFPMKIVGHSASSHFPSVSRSLRFLVHFTFFARQIDKSQFFGVNQKFLGACSQLKWIEMATSLSQHEAKHTDIYITRG